MKFVIPLIIQNNLEEIVKLHNRRYIECTSSVIQALMLFKERYPNHRMREIEKCINAGKEYIKKMQNDDGSWLESILPLYEICLFPLPISTYFIIILSLFFVA